jgi:hypothetical protein
MTDNLEVRTKMRLSISNARLAWPDLWKPKPGKDGGKAKYGANLIIDPKNPAVAELNAAFEAVAKEKWGTNAPAILNALRKQDKLALHDGDTKVEYDGFAGNLFVSARSDTRPTVIDRQRNPVSESDGKIYSGCYVNANIELWAQDHKEFGKRINAQLRGVQFVRDGDAFAAGSAADAEEFADLGDQGDGTDPLA